MREGIKTVHKQEWPRGWEATAGWALLPATDASNFVLAGNDFDVISDLITCGALRHVVSLDLGAGLLGMYSFARDAMLISNCICDAGAAALSNAMINGGLGNLTALNLSYGRIADSGAAALATALSMMPLLVELNVSGNYFGPSGVCALAEAFMTGVLTRLRALEVGNALCRDSTGHTHLNLSPEEICLPFFGDEGALALATAFDMDVFPALERLSLCHSNIRDAGAFRLAKACRSMQHLQRFDVGFNGIGDVGVQAFSQSLSEGAWPELEDLIFDSNQHALSSGELPWDAIGEACVGRARGCPCLTDA